ncbi:chaperone NapD [Vibrio sp. S17_S38]|uniref:chaperone NapD n=1 Tax=Vibrio sp. S17_S38 TaxID=2720229 RepID=UPI0016808A42|nr:chaperone NapD [Vibrio sp. S17_S38]MBD1573338.1 chaperone NapD [Vibrio sp. S17_S38]
MALNEVHISSLVVHVVPKHLTEIKAKIECLDGVEIYGESEAGKLVVVVETQNQGYITDTIDVINNLEHVLSVALVFHQIESDLDDNEMDDKQFINAE